MVHRLFMIRKKKEKVEKDRFNHGKVHTGRERGLMWRGEHNKHQGRRMAGVEGTMAREIMVGEGPGRRDGSSCSSREKEEKLGKDHNHNHSSMQHNQHQAETQHQGGWEQTLKEVIPTNKDAVGNKEVLVAAQMLQQAVWGTPANQEAKGCVGTALETAVRAGAVQDWGFPKTSIVCGMDRLSVPCVNKHKALITFDAAMLLNDHHGYSFGTGTMHKAHSLAVASNYQTYGSTAVATAASTYTSVPSHLSFEPVLDLRNLQDVQSVGQLPATILQPLPDYHQIRLECATRSLLISRKRKIDMLASSLESLASSLISTGGNLQGDLARQVKNGAFDTFQDLGRNRIYNNQRAVGLSGDTPSSGAPERQEQNRVSDSGGSGEMPTSGRFADSFRHSGAAAAAAYSDASTARLEGNPPHDRDFGGGATNGDGSEADQLLESISFDEDVYYYSEVLAEEKDQDHLSPYQCELRKHLELFEADPAEVQGSRASGRLGKVALGQIGLRCRYCARVDPARRSKGSTNYTGSLEGVYQIAQNIARAHLCGKCANIPVETKIYLIQLRVEGLRSGTGGARTGGRNPKKHWKKSIRKRGIYQFQRRGSPPRLMRRRTGVARNSVTC